MKTSLIFSLTTLLALGVFASAKPEDECPAGYRKSPMCIRDATVCGSTPGCQGCDLYHNICYPACGVKSSMGTCNCSTPTDSLGCCIPCAAGFADTGGYCAPCSAGSFADEPASTKCKACPAGKYSQHGMPGTPACSRSTEQPPSPPFINTGGLVLCNPANCPVNTEALSMAVNATDCTPCPAGMVSAGGAALCEPIPAPRTGAQSACTNDADKAVWSSQGKQNFDADMNKCGHKCMGGAKCVTGCVKSAEGYSDGCASCFGALAGCTKKHCLAKCLKGESAACVQCTQDNCDGPFLACSGIPKSDLPPKAW